MTSEVRHKRGDVREDGMVFWEHSKTCKNGERWVTSLQFVDLCERSARRIVEFRARKRASLLPKEPKQKQSREVTLAKARERTKRWNAANPGRHSAYLKDRSKRDPLFALKSSIRSRVSQWFKKSKFKKPCKTAEMLGASWEVVQSRIESLFFFGMCWANRSFWHLDHIVPLDFAETAEEAVTLGHFTNLRPMWGPDNCSKNAKLPAEHELPADLHPKAREIWQRAKDSACTK